MSAFQECLKCVFFPKLISEEQQYACEGDFLWITFYSCILLVALCQLVLVSLQQFQIGLKSKSKALTS